MKEAHTEESRRGPFIDFGLSSIKVLFEGRGWELPVERGPDGRLTVASRAQVLGGLRSFLRETANGTHTALCGLPCRGVSVRRLRIPPASRDETRRLMSLQVERELPLPPDQLAWGYCVYDSENGVTPPADKGPREAGVVALRSDVLDQYTTLLTEAGIIASFEVGALAAALLCSPLADFCLLDIGRGCTELTHVAAGRPVSVRSLPWGGNDVTGAIAKSLGVGDDVAEERKLAWKGSLAGEASSDEIAAVARAALDPFVQLVRDAWPRTDGEDGRPPEKLLLTGGGALLPGLAPELERRLGVPCAALDVDGSTGRSAVTLGLEQQANRGVEVPQLHAPAPRRSAGDGREPRILRWAVAATALVVVSLCLRYAPPIFGLPGLRAKLATEHERLQELPSVDKELGFMENLEARQLPLLEMLAALSKSAPKDTLIIDFTANRRGTVSLTGTVPKDPNSLRRSMMLSKWFSDVLLQNVNETQDHRFQFNMTANYSRPPETDESPPEGEMAGTPPAIAKGQDPAPESPAGAPPAGTSAKTEPTKTEPTKSDPAKNDGGKESAPEKKGTP